MAARAILGSGPWTARHVRVDRENPNPKLGGCGSVERVPFLGTCARFSGGKCVKCIGKRHSSGGVGRVDFWRWGSLNPKVSGGTENAGMPTKDSNDRRLW